MIFSVVRDCNSQSGFVKMATSPGVCRVKLSSRIHFRISSVIFIVSSPIKFSEHLCYYYYNIWLSLNNLLFILIYISSPDEKSLSSVIAQKNISHTKSSLSEATATKRKMASQRALLVGNRKYCSPKIQNRKMLPTKYSPGFFDQNIFQLNQENDAKIKSP